VTAGQVVIVRDSDGTVHVWKIVTVENQPGGSVTVTVAPR